MCCICYKAKKIATGSHDLCNVRSIACIHLDPAGGDRSSLRCMAIIEVNASSKRTCGITMVCRMCNCSKSKLS